MRSKKTWLWLAVAAALLGWTGYSILRQQTPGELLAALTSARWQVLLLAAPLMALYLGCEAKATHWTLRALGCPQSYARCCRYACAGFFFSNITPSASGGQPAQVYCMSRDGVPAALGTLDMLLVTIGYQTATLGYGALALATLRRVSDTLGGEVVALLAVGFAVFAALTAAMLGLLFCPGPGQAVLRWGVAVVCRLRPRLDRAALTEKADAHLDRYRQGARLLRQTPGLLPGVLLMSAGQLACTYGMPYLVYRAFGLDQATLWTVLALQALCALAVGCLPLPGSAGAAERVFLRGFAAVFGGGLVAPAMILTRTLSCYLPLLVTGGVMLLTRTRGKAKKGLAIGGDLCYDTSYL